MCVGSLAGVTYLHYTVLMSPKKDETTVHFCDPTLSVLLMFGVSKRLQLSINFAFVVSRSIFLLLFFLLLFQADQISCRSYLGSVYRMWALAVSCFSIFLHYSLQPFLLVFIRLFGISKIDPSPKQRPKIQISLNG